MSAAAVQGHFMIYKDDPQGAVHNVIQMAQIKTFIPKEDGDIENIGSQFNEIAEAKKNK